MKRFAIASLLVVAACHSDTTGPGQGGGGTSGVDNMTVGEVRVLTPSQVPNGLQFSATANATDYLIVVGNSNPTLDVVSSYVVKGDLLAGGTERSSAIAPSYLQVVSGSDGDAQEAFESRLRNYERAHLSPARAAIGTNGLQPRRSITQGSVPTVGTTIALNVPTVDCNTFVATTGKVVKVTNRAIIVLDNNAPSGGFTDTDYQAIGNEFDTMIYPTDSSYFGKPTDIDANTHIYLYYTPEVNKLTPPNQSSFVGGFFFAGDLFPATGAGQTCKESNMGEIFYLLAPDPLGTFGNVRSTNTVRQGTRGTISHEFQHMINAGNRIVGGASTFEAVWLDEGLAHFAEEVNGRNERGFGDLQTLSDADIFVQGNQADIDIYNAFFFQNFARLRTWLQRPDTASGLSSHADKNLSSRGAIWALLRWSADNVSGSDPRGLTRKLVAGPDSGVPNLTSKTGQPLDSLLAGWLTSMYSDHLGIPNLGSKYSYRSFNMRDVVAAANSGTYPLQVTTLSAGANVSTTSRSGSATYYRLSIAANTPRTVLVQDPGGTNVSFPGAHFYVLRID